METKVLCPSLPDLLKKTVLTFCEGSVKFESCLEVIGSLHIRSDNEKVVTFMIDEQVCRSNSRVHDESRNGANNVDKQSSLIKYGDTNQEQSSEWAMPRKSRKTKKPLKKVDYYLSSDAESEADYMMEDSIGQSQVHIITRQSNLTFSKPVSTNSCTLPTHTELMDSNASLSSDDLYVGKVTGGGQEHNGDDLPVNMSVSQQPIVLEATSTRPDNLDLQRSSSDLEPQDSKEQDGQCEARDLLPQSSTGSACTSGQYSATTDAQANSTQVDVVVTDACAPAATGSMLGNHLHKSVVIKAENSQYSNYDSVSGSVATTPSSDLEGDRLESVQNMRGVICPPVEVSRQQFAYNAAIMSKMWAIQQQQSASLQQSLYNSQAALELAQHADYGLSGSQSDGWEKIPCPMCNRTLKSEKMLQLHLNTAHTHKSSYPCKICGKVFYAPSSLHSHKRRNHTSNEQKIKCPQCYRHFAFKSELIRHIAIHHESQGAHVSEYTKKQIIEKQTGVNHRCPYCGLVLKSRECLALHMNAKHTQKQRYPCKVCGKVFYAPSSRFCHMRRVHASAEQKFKCSDCDKVFSFHYELRNHVQIMHREKAGSENTEDGTGNEDYKESMDCVNTDGQ